MKRFDRSSYHTAIKQLEERQARENNLTGSKLNTISGPLTISTPPIAHDQPEPGGWLKLDLFFTFPTGSNASNVVEFDQPIEHIAELQYHGGGARGGTSGTAWIFKLYDPDGGPPVVNACTLSPNLTPNTDAFISGYLNDGAFMQTWHDAPMPIGLYPKGEGKLRRLKLEIRNIDLTTGAISTPTDLVWVAISLRAKTLAHGR